jgi:hypothetical protein
VERVLNLQRSRKETVAVNITARTAAALTITASSLVLAVGAGASDSFVPGDGDDADAWLTHCCVYGDEGPSNFVTLPTWSSATALNDGSDYGSAELIQLGHGPGGPSRAPLPGQAEAGLVDDSWVAGAV